MQIGIIASDLMGFAYDPLVAYRFLKP
jgi:hypothetical protein